MIGYDTLIAEVGAKRLMEFPTGIVRGVSMQQCSVLNLFCMG